MNNPVNAIDPNGENVMQAMFLWKHGTSAQTKSSVHTALDAGGFAGPVGPFADAANSVLHLAEGNIGQAALSGVAIIPLAGDAIKGVALGAKHGDEVVEGIYKFTDTTGKTYCGQSCNVPRRLKEHVASGKLDPNQAVETTEVLGGKTVREVAEHKQLMEVTGGVDAKDSDLVSNMRNPIGKKRENLLNE